MTNPYLIEGPALVSFSGGRTSGYMLKRILDAHGGVLPANVHVVFANTGKEWSVTLDFVAECGRQWAVPITWIERTWETPEGFSEVGHNSADRTGRPLRETIERRRFLPNGVSRFCTSEGKVHVMRRWMQAQGYKRWINVIGLRRDEPKRVKKQHRRNLLSKEVYTTVMPLDVAGVSKADVRAWWREQPFDLQLPHDSDAFGNCDLCHLKHRAKLLQVLLHDPSAADWWIDCEAWATDIAQKPSGARFRKNGPSYAELKDYVLRYPQAARTEVDAFLESERIAQATGDLFVDGESIDCACTD